MFANTTNSKVEPVKRTSNHSIISAGAIFSYTALCLISTLYIIELIIFLGKNRFI